MNAWEHCRYLTCSVLPVRMACNLTCRFCFSRSSVSTLEPESGAPLDLARYFAFARARGATRLVVTGGGEPLLRPARALEIVRAGRAHFDEIALFSNGSRLDRRLSEELQEAGLSYLCWSRHHPDDAVNRRVMGEGAPALAAVLDAAGTLPVRATCVMAQGFVDSRQGVLEYIDALGARGVRQFTFKHTYVAYPRSVFAGSPEDRWAAAHHVDFDPFANDGEVLARLPWGPAIRRRDGVSVCYYWEPSPDWEKENRICRSINLLSDGKVYASLEDAESLLFQLAS